MKSAENTPFTLGKTPSIKECLDALKTVSETGKSTQETHRKSMDSDTVAMGKLMDIIAEQSKKSESSEERDRLLRIARETVEKHAERVESHKQDSNSVFKQVLAVAAVAMGLGTAASVAFLKSKT